MFAERLKIIRNLTGLSQSKFAKTGGVSLRSQQDYESGKSSPHVEYLINLAEGGVDVAFLLTGQKEAQALNQEISELVVRYQQAPEILRTAIRAILSIPSENVSVKNNHVSFNGNDNNNNIINQS